MEIRYRSKYMFSIPMIKSQSFGEIELSISFPHVEG